MNDSLANMEEDTECNVMQAETLKYFITDVFQICIFLSCMNWLLYKKGDRITT